jgi:homoserine O-succinyltransferase
MITIGILNNMQESAIRSTERQFGELIFNAAGPKTNLRVRWFSEQPRQGYESIEDLWNCSYLDGLIITGSEPRPGSLRDEPNWNALTRTIDWAKRHTSSTLFSCLAAHAAVLHLDGIERRRLSGKLSGVFTSDATGDHPLLDGMPKSWRAPHSRHNTLSAASLLVAGYKILSHSRYAGVDLFEKSFGDSQFVFMQSHPEYDDRALMREYRRDVRRFLAGEQRLYPELPANVFEEFTALDLVALCGAAMRDPTAEILGRVEQIVSRAEAPEPWEAPAVALYRNWLGVLMSEQASVAAWKIAL